MTTPTTRRRRRHAARASVLGITAIAALVFAPTSSGANSLRGRRAAGRAEESRPLQGRDRRGHRPSHHRRRARLPAQASADRRRNSRAGRPAPPSAGTAAIASGRAPSRSGIRAGTSPRPSSSCARTGTRPALSMAASEPGASRRSVASSAILLSRSTALWAQRPSRPSTASERTGPGGLTTGEAGHARAARRLVIIRRDAHRLYFYKGARPLRVFTVATGGTWTPTPHGRFRIVSKYRHPWWYPPDSSWATHLDPIPPGPENPLGTRWMGLSVSGRGHPRHSESRVRGVLDLPRLHTDEEARCRIPIPLGQGRNPRLDHLGAGPETRRLARSLWEHGVDGHVEVRRTRAEGPAGLEAHPAGATPADHRKRAKQARKHGPHRREARHRDRTNRSARTAKPACATA